MPYRSGSPSSNNNIGASGYCVAFQGDGLYRAAVGEGRAHLKYNIRIRLFSNSARFQNLFRCGIFFRVLTVDSIFLCNFLIQNEVFLTSFGLCEQTVDSLNFKHSPDLLFLKGAKFFRML